MVARPMASAHTPKMTLVMVSLEGGEGECGEMEPLTRLPLNAANWGGAMTRARLRYAVLSRCEESTDESHLKSKAQSYMLIDEVYGTCTRLLDSSYSSHCVLLGGGKPQRPRRKVATSDMRQ